MKQGFDYKAIWIAISFPTGTFLGSIIIASVIGAFPRITPILTALFYLLTLATSLTTMVVKVDLKNVFIFITLFGLIGFFTIVNYARTTTSELVARTETEKEKYVILNFIRLVRELISGIVLLVTGYCLDRGKFAII